MSLITPKVGLKEVSKGELVGFEDHKIGRVECIRTDVFGRWECKSQKGKWRVKTPKLWKLKSLLLKHEISYLVRNARD